jgi:hypothetical protein
MQPTNDPPIEAVYPIVPHGPQVVRLNEYSALYRISITPPFPVTPPPEPRPAPKG